MTQITAFCVDDEQDRKIKRAEEVLNSMNEREMALRIVELQDALEFAEEVVGANYPDIPDSWKLVPVAPTADMLRAAAILPLKATRGMHDATCYKVMVAAAPNFRGE